MAETESSIASTPMTTRTILTVLDTRVLRCFLRELEAARACCSGVGSSAGFFFLFAIVGLSHNESNKRHCVTTQPRGTLGALGQVNLHHFGAKGTALAAGS